MGAKIYWRCFHCGETFTKAQERWARQHFGANEDAKPACLMRVPGEHHLLEILRRQEADLQNYRSEDTELWRALHSMSADHARALIREEEKGYERGLRDGLNELRATTLPALPAPSPPTRSQPWIRSECRKMRVWWSPLWRGGGVKLRVWWIPQVPMTPFFVPVATIEEGKKICEVLADYDQFQFNNRIKPDYCNAGGMSFCAGDNKWSDFDPCDEDDLESAKQEISEIEARHE